MTETPESLRAEAARLTARADELEATPLTRDDLDRMSPEEIVEAKAAGRLTHLLNPTTTQE